MQPQDNGATAVSADKELLDSMLQERAAKVPWTHAPAWAARYVVRAMFGEVIAQWQDESGLTTSEVVPAFTIARGEQDVVIERPQHGRR